MVMSYLHYLYIEWFHMLMLCYVLKSQPGCFLYFCMVLEVVLCEC